MGGMNQPAAQWTTPTRQDYVRKFALFYCGVTLSFSAYFTPQDFNLKVAVIVNVMLFLIGAPHWFRNTRIPPYWLNVISQIGNAGASVWICSFLGPTSHINLVAIPQFIMALMMFSGIHPRTTIASAFLCLWLLSLPLFEFTNTWYLHKRMPEHELVILRELLDISIFAFSTYQFKIVSDAWSLLLSESEQEKTRAQKQNDWRRRLLHILGHDIKEPVVHSLLAIRGLRKKLGDSETILLNQLESAQSSIKEIITNVEHSNQVLEDGNVQLKGMPESELTVGEVLGRIQPIYESRLREKNITLDTSEAHDDHRIRAETDTFIYQIFMNLLSNAVKFTPEGGTITIRTELHPDGSVSWTITDPGQGIPAEAFGEVSASTPGTLGEKGSGLGLKIARAFAAQNRVELSWSSPALGTAKNPADALPRGTCVRITQKLRLKD